MKKNVILLIFTSILVVVLLIINGCSKKEEKKTIIGVWQYYVNETITEEIYYSFDKKNTGSYHFYSQDREFTYEDDGKELIIKYKDDNTVFRFKYTISKNILTLTDMFNESIKYIGN